MGRAGVFTVNLTLLALAGCGYMGDPLPPALNIPVPVTDLTAYQSGNQIILQFKPILATTDRLILPRLAGLELRGAPAGPPPFDLGRWAAHAPVLGTEELAGPTESEKPVTVRIPAAPYAGQETVFCVRTISPQRKFSDWSNVVVLRVVDPPATPAGLRLEPRAHAVVLRWEPGVAVAGSRWRIWRKAEGQEDFAENATADRTEWSDAAVEYGKRYEYAVQKLVPAGTGVAESGISAPAVLQYEDRFAPGVPAGLTAIQGLRSVELAWERVVDDDLSGYQVYRAVGDGEFQKLGPLAANPSASDSTVEPGKRYRYRVASVDLLNNESEPSAIIEITAP